MAKKEQEQQQPAGDVRARVLADMSVDGVAYRANDVVTVSADVAAAHGLDADEAACTAALDVFGGRARVHADEVAAREAAKAEADQSKA